jgi:lipoprotein NlpD
MYSLVIKCSYSMAVSRFVSLIGMLCLIQSCAFNPAPVSIRTAPPSELINHHTVSRGETLFAIAWRYERDMVALARVNGIPPPYKISVGQRLNLDTSSLPRLASQRRESVARATKISRQQQPVKRQGPSNQSGTKEAGVSKNPPLKSTYKFATGKVNWQWPTKGSVSRYYDASKVFKGINIQSVSGRPVKTAAAGVVVYAGSGLRGYGKLIIVKHSAAYLSAYAHNKALLVKEGEALKKGVTIATVGGDSGNAGRLYFEIRKNGKPVDPMRLLPKQ